MTKEYHIQLQGRDYFIREDMVESLLGYVQHGTPPGSFLRAVLAHDLMTACQHADHWNLPQLPAYAHYIYWEVPSPCHGSYEIIDTWIKRGGIDGGSSDSTPGTT